MFDADSFIFVAEYNPAQTLRGLAGIDNSPGVPVPVRQWVRLNGSLAGTATAVEIFLQIGMPWIGTIYYDDVRIQ
jgi:hypothetical protein